MTITTGWSNVETWLIIGATDAELIVPSGITIGPVYVQSTCARLRIRGSSDGSTRGGLVGQIFTEGSTDIILDGVDINGGNSSGVTQSVRFAGTGPDHAFVHNCRIIGEAQAWLGAGRHIMIANSNLYGGARTRAANGFVEGNTFRHADGPVVIVDSRLQSTRYNTIRTKPEGSGSWVEFYYNTDIVSVAEGRHSLMWNNLNSDSNRGLASIYDSCRLYSYTDGGCGLGFQMDIEDLDFSRVRNCVFYNGGSATIDQTGLNSIAAGGTGDHDWSVGNTFAAIPGSEPAWGGPGNPRSVPLPTGDTPIVGEGSCPGLVW